MTLKREHTVKVFVYVVESPSAEDFYNGRGEGLLIAQAASLNQIPCAVRSVTSRGMLDKALTEGLYAEMLRYPNMVPMLHFSSHGNGNGIALTDGTFVSWDDLRALLKPLNTAFQGNLFLCMSSCEGGFASCMSMHPGDKEFPYFMMVGNSGTPTWAETAVGYTTLYHYIASGQNIQSAVEAMKVASGNDSFFCEGAEEIHDYFVNYLKDFETTEQQALDQIAGIVDEREPGAAGEVKNRIAAETAPASNLALQRTGRSASHR